MQSTFAERQFAIYTGCIVSLVV